MVNPAADDSMYGGMTPGNRRFLAGVGVSVAVHLLLLFAYRHTGPSTPLLQPGAPSFITITIRPPAPPKAQTPPPTPARAAAPRRARPSTPTPVIAVPPAPESTGQESSGDPFAVQQAAEPMEGSASDTPAFDMNAARQTARQLAGQTKLGREGTAHAQFPDPPLETESKFAKAISKAKRRNCKDGIPGGLLAPLFLAMDKKDSGCKW